MYNGTLTWKTTQANQESDIFNEPVFIGITYFPTKMEQSVISLVNDVTDDDGGNYTFAKSRKEEQVKRYYSVNSTRLT